MEIEEPTQHRNHNEARGESTVPYTVTVLDAQATASRIPGQHVVLTVLYCTTLLASCRTRAAYTFVLTPASNEMHSNEPGRLNRIRGKSPASHEPTVLYFVASPKPRIPEHGMLLTTSKYSTDLQTVPYSVRVIRTADPAVFCCTRDAEKASKH
jgi:hypothetical protein